MAQLSPWLLWPPDGLNLKQGTCGELFGYGYLPLPLTAGQDHHRRQGRPDRGPMLDAVPEHAELQRPGGVLHPLLLVRRRGRRSRASAECSWIAVPPSPTGPCRWRPSTSPASRPWTPRARPTPASPPPPFPVGPNGDSRARASHHLLQQEGALGRGEDLVRRRGRGQRRDRSRRRPSCITFTGKGGATWRIYPRRHSQGREGARGLEFLRHADGAGSQYLRLPLGLQLVAKQTDSKDWPAGDASRVLSAW